MKSDPGHAARPSSAPIGALIVCAMLLTTACASSGSPKPGPYQVGARTEGPPPLTPPPVASTLEAARPAAGGGPPGLAPAQPSIVGMPSTRVSITAKDEQLPDVISRMARQVGLTAIIDPSVRGPVTRTLRNVSLNDAMLNLVGNQFQYQVQNGTLVVMPIQLVQHTYTVDYLQMSRLSTASTVVARGTQGGQANQSIVTGPAGAGTGVSPTTGGLASSGSDVILSSSNVDVWGELTSQLESILFGGDTTRNAAVFNNVSLGGARPYTRCSQGGTCLRISPLTSLVDITASPEKQEEVARYIALYKAAITRQVSIKAQVLEVNLDRTTSFGVDWTAVLNTAQGAVAFNTDPSSVVLTGNATFNLGFGNLTVKAVVNALQSVGDVSVVATPSTNAMNQQKASFNVTRQQQFASISTTPNIVNGINTGNTQSVSIQVATVGLIFDVLPQISDDNIVMMAIRPSVTSLVSTQVVTGPNGTSATLPVIDHRETDTMARVRSGETIMIGGLIQKQTTNERRGIPFLMDIPWIGALFSTTTVIERTSELVIFLTPEIVSGQPPGGR